MDKNEKENLKHELSNIEFDISKLQFDSSKLIADKDDLPELDPNDIYDYDSEITEIEQESKNVIEELSKIYLHEENMLNHPYIKLKKLHDSNNLAKLNFLVKSSQRSLINILRDLDTGRSDHKMYELLSLLQKETRENVKLSSTTLAEIEKFYKKIQEDLIIEDAIETDEEEGKIVDFKNLNTELGDFLNKKNDEYEERKNNRLSHNDDDDKNENQS